MRRFSNRIPWQILIRIVSSDQASLAAQISPSIATSPYPYLLKLHIRCFSIHGVSPIVECPSHPVSPAKKSVCVAEFLVDRLGFSKEEADPIASKVSSFKSKQRLDSVVHFFEQIGFDETQIRMVVSSVPRILGCGVEKFLRPKITVIQEIGISGSDLVKFISNNPQIIRASLHSTNARQNIKLMRSYGVPDEVVQKFFLNFRRIHTWSPNLLENVMLKVEKEFRIPRESGMFMHVVGEIGSTSKKTLESKYEIFKSYGWTQYDVLTMTRKCPTCLSLSDVNIRTRLDYFMKELGFDPSYLASKPVLLKYSLENRILPRNAILKVLKKKGVHESHLNFYSAMAATEAGFLRRFVLGYKDAVPDICDVYSEYKVEFSEKAAGRSLK